MTPIASPNKTAIKPLNGNATTSGKPNLTCNTAVA